MLEYALSGEKPQSKVEEVADKVNIERKESSETKPEKKFSNEELKISWLQFAEKQKTEEPRLYSILITNIPKIKEDYKLYIRLANRSQEEHLNEIKAKLISFLQKELENSKVEFEIDVVESSSNEKKLYTNKDKFDHLVKKNPALARMKQQLNLDFD